MSDKKEKQEEMKQEEMKQEQPEQVDAVADVAPKAKAKVQKKVVKALVNMSLPSGTCLVVGEPVELSAIDKAHLKKHFDLKQIVEG